MKSGPESLEALLDWPADLVQRIASHPTGACCLQRIASLVHSGLVTHTDCSGKMSPEVALNMTFRALAPRGVTLPPGGLVCWRACDNAPVCQRLIMANDFAPVHLFKGLLDKLTQAEQCSVRALRPDKNATVEVKTAAYTAIGQYLRTNSAQLYGRGKRSATCLLHPGESCALSWQDPVGTEAWQRPLTINMTGPPCRPFSIFGGRKLWAHPDMEAWHLWSNDVSEQDYDLVGMENAEHFVTDLFEEAMPDNYDTKHAVFGVHELGWPVRRSRFFGTAINQKTLIWFGPTGKDVTEHFLSFFERAVRLEGDCFVGLDTPEHNRALKMHLALNRGSYLSSEAADQVAYEDLLWATARSSLDALRIRLHSGQAKVGLGGTFIGDLSQSPDRPRAGAFLPAQARGSALYSLSKDRLLTPAEIDLSMGWPCLPLPGCESYMDLQGYSSAGCQLSFAEQRSLSGNGMVLPQVAAWWLYIFSHTVRRELLERMAPPMSSAADELDAHFDDLD
jgi:site-specific DNA-cytosine methylase